MTDVHRPLGHDETSFFWSDAADRVSGLRRQAIDDDAIDQVEHAPFERAGPWRDLRVGVIANPASHRNRGIDAAQFSRSVRIEGADLYRAMPRSHADLATTLARFAEAQVDLIVISGGDGTVRDVITAGRDIFPAGLPQLAVVPSGKTNAIALDLGIPADWTIEAAVASARRSRVKLRRPLEIQRDVDGSTLCGFIFGAGAFVQATGVAQHTHAAGAYNGIAVAMSLGWAMIQTLFGAAGNSWRSGEDMAIRFADGRIVRRRTYMMLGSTLKRLPLGLKPFGRVRGGLKLLAIEAPPKRLLTLVPALLRGSEKPALAEAGYHRMDLTTFKLRVDNGFILDGELYQGGELTIRESSPVRFVVP